MIFIFMVIYNFFFCSGIDLWLEFLQFSIGYMSDSTGTDKVRELMERALRAGSLHVPNGNFLFEVYIEFEKLILTSIKVGKKLFIINVFNLYKYKIV